MENKIKAEIEKIFNRYSAGYIPSKNKKFYLEVVDVVEKWAEEFIKRIKKRLKEEINDFLTKNKTINKIFKEEFGDELI